MNTTETIIFFSIFTVIIIGECVLEYYISKRQNKKLGLILPVLNFISAFVIVLNRAAIFGQDTTFATIAKMLWELLLYSIPAGVLMVVNLVCHEKQHNKDEIRKMNIQDL